MGPRSVFITGANRGLGLQFVQHILAQPVPPKHVFAACRDPAKAEVLVALSKDHKNLTVVKLDVTKDGDLELAFEHTKSVLKDEGLNLLINNAAIMPEKQIGGFIEHQTRQRILSSFDSNVAGPILVTQKFLPLLQKAAEDNSSQSVSYSRAAVIHLSSSLGSVQLALKGDGNYYQYCSTKAALNMITALMAVQFKRSGILVAALHPGWVKTDMGGPTADLDKETSISNCWTTIAGLTQQSSGLLIRYDGTVLPW